MPIRRPEPEPTQGFCEECNKPCVMEEDDEGEMAPPIGWVYLQLSRTIPNPDFLQERDNQARYVEEGLKTLKKQVEGAGGEWSPQMEIEAKEGLIEQSEPQSDPYYVQAMEALLCPKHAEYAQTRLGVPDWDEED